MHRTHSNLAAWLTALALGALILPAGAQMPGQGGGRSQPQESHIVPEGVSAEKPEAAAKKAFKAGMKSMTKAKGFESAAAEALNPDKKSAALEKLGDAYDRALDQFTEALRNDGTMFEAWNNVGYIHLRLGAFTESIDDYNHTLALKPDLPEAILHRAEAYLAVDRLDEAKSAYMDLFNHERLLADELFSAMQKWLAAHRADANGMRASVIDAFDKWLQERDGIAKQTAALPP